MKIIGDLHNPFNIPYIIRNIKEEVLCVGDVGIGLPGIGDRPSLSKRFWFIRGNHDKPEACLSHPQYAIDYGMWRGMFLIAGAKSVDIDIDTTYEGKPVRMKRTEGKDWWKDEQLTDAQCYEALTLYKKAKPRIVISHDCPFSLQGIINDAVENKNPFCKVFGKPKPYPQVVMMDEMLKIHEPDLWIFGHWHIPIELQTKFRTKFRCIDIAEIIDIEEELQKL